jgi:hypothetical protein
LELQLEFQRSLLSSVNTLPFYLESICCEVCGSVDQDKLIIHHEGGGGTKEIHDYWKSNQGLYNAILDLRRPVSGFMEWGPLQLLCLICHKRHHGYSYNSNYDELEFLEILTMARSKNGVINRDSTVLDEQRRITFGFVDDRNQIVEVKIPLDSLEIT